MLRQRLFFYIIKEMVPKMPEMAQFKSSKELGAFWQEGFGFYFLLKLYFFISP